MKTISPTKRLLPATVLTAAICATLWSLSNPSLPTHAAESPKAPPANLQIDDTPLARDAGLTVSFAPVVKKVAPSVVSIFTTKKVATYRFPDAFPFFDDPTFRRWFGQGEPDDPSQGRSRPQFRKEHGLGSGVIVTDDGYILSNNHVVQGADEIKVALVDEKTQFTAKVVGRDPQTDIAVLKIDATGLPALSLTDSDQLQVGDVVLALGNPFGVGQSVSHGIISALGRGGLGIEAYEDFIQTDAPINPGNSGGALIDAKGRLVGINTAIASRTGASAGVGFAIPINMARNVMEKLLQEGRVVRGFLGVGIQDLTPDLAREFNAPDTSGAVVTQVEPKGAAAEAGLKTGDIIVEFDGETIEGSRQLRLKVAHTAPGTKAALKVLRDGKTKSFTVTLKELPAPRSMPGESTPGNSSNEVLKEVAVTDLTPALRQQFDIPETVKGALVSEVATDSAAYEAGLRVGAVLQEINRKAIHNAEEAVQATQNVSEKRVLLRVWSRGSSRYIVVDETGEP